MIIQLKNRLVRLLKWSLISVLGLATLMLLAVGGLLSWLLLSSQAPNTIWPHLSQLTNGQVQIQSSQGRLIDGLQLEGLHIQTPQITVQIQTLEWQWQLSSLIKSKLHLNQLTLEHANIQMTSEQDQPDQASPSNNQVFGFVDYLNGTLSIDQLKFKQISMQIDQQPAYELAAFSTGLNWHDRQLTLSQVMLDYAPYQLEGDLVVRFQSASQFDGEMKMQLEGLAGLNQLHTPNPRLAWQSKWQGSLDDLSLDLNISQPYSFESKHRIVQNAEQIEVLSNWLSLDAQIHPDWHLHSLTGQTNIEYQIASSQLSAQAELALGLNDLAHSRLSGQVQLAETIEFDVQAQSEHMGWLKLSGESATSFDSFNINLIAQDFRVDWLKPDMDYQLNTELSYQLRDLKQRDSQLNIKSFDLIGLPERLQVNGQAETHSINDTDYALRVQQLDLVYGPHTGQIDAHIETNPYLTQLHIHQAQIQLGENQMQLTGRWDEAFDLSLHAQLNRLDQFIPELTGQTHLNLKAQGKRDLSSTNFKFNQGSADITTNMTHLNYQGFHLAEAQLDARIPLDKPEWAEFELQLNQLNQLTSDSSEPESAGHLIDQLTWTRQPLNQGLSSELQWQHPQLALEAQWFEANPNWRAQTLHLNWLEIRNDITGDWRLNQPTELNWQSPNQLNIAQTCLRSDQDPHAQFCFELEPQQANWQFNALPIIDWAQPWIPQDLQLNGRLNGTGQANWQTELNIEQTLSLPQLNLLMMQQGYEWPLTITNWQTEIELANQQAQLTSHAELNDTGGFSAQLNLRNHQAWSQAELDGNARLQLNEWQIGERLGELVTLHKTELNLETALFGQLNQIEHDTRARMALNFDLPILGLVAQTINLQAQVAEQNIRAHGRWQQADEREAELRFDLIDLQAQPKLMAELNTQSIELLKTNFAHLNTQANLSFHLRDGQADFNGGVNLHNSYFNLDAMPLHQQSRPHDDEVIINEQNQPIDQAESSLILNLDLRVGLGDQVKINVRDAQAFLGGELHLVQTEQDRNMRAFGEVLLRDGYINLDRRNRIQIDQSSFSFTGVMANPTLNVNLFRTVDQTTARLNITGSASQPGFVFYSTPPLSQARIINLLVFGRAGDLETEPNYESQVISAFYKLGIQNNTPVLNQLTRTLGIEDIYFDVQDQQVSSLLLGRALTDDLYVRYARDLSGQQNNAVQIFYQLTPDWLLKSDSRDSSSSVDLIFRREKE